MIPDYGFSLIIWAGCGYEGFRIEGSTLWLFLILGLALLGLSAFLWFFVYKFFLVVD
jgi:hypothetical protein